MQVFRLRKWLGLFCFSLVFGCFLASATTVEAQSCTASGCHKTSLDNSANKKKDTATTDYLPVNLFDLGITGPFYTIPQGYTNSAHDTNLQCTSCHVSQSSAHAKNMVKSDKCLGCHGLADPALNDFLQTKHANPNSNPTKFFDQTGKGSGQAFAATGRLEPVLALFQADKKTIVTKTQRLEECSVCHNYAMQYPYYKSNLGTDKLTPQVGCSACHDAHIPAPSETVMVDDTVQVTDSYTSSSGSVTVFAASPVDGRLMSYRELKPYKLDLETEAQNAKAGVWSRGSLFTRPNRVIVAGTGTIGSGDGMLANGATSDHLTFAAGGFSGNVQPHDTVFITGEASGTGTIPDDALSNPGGTVTVKATLDRTGFGVAEVIDDKTLLLDPGVVATATVTYVKATTGTGTFTVSIPFSGPATFEVKNMNTNAETLCGSCHTKGNYKYTGWGKLGTSFIDLKSTHNNDILTQYKNAGHSDILAPPFDEFSARPYGTSHNTYYPFDMSITGSGGNGSLRNKHDTKFDLTSTPDAATVYLGRPTKTSLLRIVNNYQCFQCHNGIGTIDYLKDRQGTADAQVLWGDSTVTCITCHDTHSEGVGANVRTPVYLSYNSRLTGGKANTFLDGTSIPAGVGTGIICLFCHQGRESGLTVYRAIVAKGVDPYASPDQVIDPVNGLSFINPHYLDSGAILWSRNAWEYLGKEYSEGIPAHQTLNCAGCHMGEANAENTEGGHTWKPRVETCQTCHGPTATSFAAIPAIGDYDGSKGDPGTAFEEIGTLDIANPANDTGLYGQVRAALAAQTPPIYYNPDAYPYFFTTSDPAQQTNANAFKAWTTNTLSAAFNLAWAYKSGGCVPYHNAWYAAAILQDSLAALGVDTTAYFRPSIFTRAASDYSTTP